MNKKKLYKEIQEKVYNRPEELDGKFNTAELEEIKSYFKDKYSQFSDEEFSKALTGITMSGRGVYDRDVEVALRCAIENRESHPLYEWD